MKIALSLLFPLALAGPADPNFRQLSDSKARLMKDRATSTPTYKNQPEGHQCCGTDYGNVPKPAGVKFDACIAGFPYYSYVGYFRDVGTECSKECIQQWGADWKYGVEEYVTLRIRLKRTLS